MNANLSDRADRTTLPPLAATAAVKFPDVQEFTLSNGLKVMFAQRSSVPVINMNLMMDAGFAVDQGAFPTQCETLPAR
jgi:zinc protease